jgi:hypothetical protein
MKLSNANLLPPMEQVSDSSSSSSVSSSDSSQDLVSRIQEVVCNALPLAPHFGYKKVIVTGGAGFIGSHVDEILLARGDDVVIFDEMNDYYDVRIKQTHLDLLRDAYPDEKRLKIYTRIACYVFLVAAAYSFSFYQYPTRTYPPVRQPVTIANKSTILGLDVELPDFNGVFEKIQQVSPLSRSVLSGNRHMATDGTFFLVVKFHS